MQEKLRGYLDNVKDKWNSLEKGQKIKIGITAFVLILTLAVTIFITTRPRMMVLYSGKDITTISNVKNALDDAGIYNRLIRNGTGIEVEDKNVPLAQVTIEKKNVLNTGKFTYQDALDYSTMGTTETIKRSNFKRVKESDLGTNLQYFDGVSNATVMLEVPDDTGFLIESRQQARASVMLTTTAGFDRGQAAAIARYVSRSVKGLEPENIVIIDQRANELFSGTQDTATSLNSEYDLEKLRKSELENKIKSNLAPMYNDIKVIANLVFNWDKSTQNSQIYSSSVPDSDAGMIFRNSQEKQTATGATTVAEPGIGSNTQTQPTYQNQQQQQGSSASTSSSTTDYALNKVETSTEASVGNIVPAQSSVAVWLYRYKKYDEDVMTKGNKLGGLTWADFKEQNENERSITVPQDILDSLKTATGLANISVVGYELPVFVDKQIKPLNIEQIIMFVILALLIILLAYGLIKMTKPVEVTELEPELSVEDLLVSTQLEEQKEAAEEQQKLQEIDFNKDSEAKKLIDKFVSEKPEAVAQLLRNWLNNEWE